MGEVPSPVPLEDDGLVMPAGWLRHEDGHGYTILEMQQQEQLELLVHVVETEHLTLTERVA